MAKPKQQNMLKTSLKHVLKNDLLLQIKILGTSQVIGCKDVLDWTLAKRSVDVLDCSMQA